MRSLISGLKSCPSRVGTTDALDSGGSLISGSGVDSTTTLRVLQIKPRRGHLIATPQGSY
jgi:hypothetical protein